MFRRLRRAASAAWATWRSPSEPTEISARKGISSDEASKALARIMIAACYRHSLNPSDALARHFLYMRKYDMSPLAYASRCTRMSEGELLALAKNSIELELLEHAVLPGSGWSAPNLEEGVFAISSLEWESPESLAPRTTRR